ncbi:MAG: hypothetical protein AB200_00445 [Parcubacteria bacterium C7867-005]|nr:MAG: hypothetical protein AB200_00445 [Parcubacteria bacterium C7867-005]
MPHKSSDKIIGIWKFSHKVSPETLAEVAEKWATEDSRYEHLYVRQVSKDQHGIGFEYRAYEGIDSENHKQSYDEYFEKTTDKLKREFGNDLAGWDISSSSYVIK